MLHLYNTLTHKKETFRPINGKNVGFYTCGITAYYTAHIGNMRKYTMDDVIKRVLMHNGYSVEHIENVTDVGHLAGDANTTDDKMRVSAETQHKTMKQIAEAYFGMFLKESDYLNIIKPNQFLFASENIQVMFDLIKKLDDKGYLYKIGTGMYYDTSKFKNYGKLTGSTFKQLNEKLKAGATVERVDGIRNITDFAVWRFAEGTDMIWDSPWGRGFPGWHIECSAMSMKALGEHFDVHTGGVDHIAIHHSNEIAQSEAATGQKFVNYWVHHEFLVVNGQKMSKSIGNIYTVQQIIDKGYSPMALRLFYMSGHYRQILNFTFEALTNTENTIKSIYNFLGRLSEAKNKSKNDDTKEFKKKISDHKRMFFKTLDDDINTPMALAEMHAVMNDTNQRESTGKLNSSEAKFVIKTMLSFDSVLGLRFDEHIKSKKEPLDKEIKRLIEEREAARNGRDFKKADDIRNVLKDKYHIIIEDTKEGMRWHKE
ncbi:MAG: cysteine--tRNA ligase [Candidatus Marsarchaeota archaeon]|nr:cysteine--tRNA ligase [Candidatus Marsarchaeota archaeon]